jgi:hypothetical protein
VSFLVPFRCALECLEQVFILMLTEVGITESAMCCCSSERQLNRPFALQMCIGFGMEGIVYLVQSISHARTLCKEWPLDYRCQINYW